MELRYNCEQILDSLQLGKVAVYQSLIKIDSSLKRFHDPSYPLALLQFLVKNHPNLPQNPSIDISELIQFSRSLETDASFIEKYQKKWSIPSDYPNYILVLHSLVNIFRQFLDSLTEAGCNLAPNDKILDQLNTLLPKGQWTQIQELLQVFPMTLPRLTIEDRSQLMDSPSIDTNLTAIISSRKEKEYKPEKKSKGKKEKESPNEKGKIDFSNDGFIEDTFLLLQIISPQLIQGR